MSERGKHRILIVDDEPLIADTLVLIFTASGYAARGVYSAEKALAMAPEWQPELAIIDVCLPNMNGIDLAIRMKSEYPECHLSLFSGQPATRDLLRDAAQSFEILSKPVHPREMLRIASQLLPPKADEAPAALPN